jgi:type II secretion system protein C
MKKGIFIMQNFKYILIFVFGVSLSAFLWGISFFFLKKEPVVFNKIKRDYTFYSINLTDIFFNSSETQKIKAIETLKGVKLKAVFFDGKKGFIILEEKGKSVFVDLNGFYKGYKLIKIGKNYAIFEKNNKRYKLEIENKINGKIYTNTTSNKLVVSRDVFRSYLYDFNKIWHNIGIVKVNRGYVITYIKKGSVFDKLGLKKGDVLLEVNGRELKSDADAWDLYRNAKNFKNFEVKILRKNQEKVLYYEVD